MKKIFTTLLVVAMGSAAFSQWSPTAMQGEKVRPETQVKNFYALDLGMIRSQLSRAVEAGKGAAAVEIKLPTLDGKIERFAVYSAPVVVQSLADRYQLGSYAGVGIDDPTKFVRFSVSPYDLQSMIFSNGEYQFIEAQNEGKTVYGVFPKTKKTDKAFECHSGEDFLSKQQMDKLSQNANFTTSPTDFSRNSDQKFRTYRLAISVTGEYTQFFGGVPQALAAINATMTRVNGVFEKDFAIRMLLQDFPQLIYTDPSTDPYSPAASGAAGAWNGEVQTTLTNVIGNAAYDIGHLFGRSGGGGSAGDIGNVCRDAAASGDDSSKGSAFTSPGTGAPQGDNFDIDYVAHEMGHQFGAWHTFSHGIHSGSIAHMEPGSGSTIMGYAGITSADVQPHSDPYFHTVSINQVQAYVNTQSCAVSTAITNTPPVITAMPPLTIPKATAFVLTANATDAEGDPMTYTWEQYDSATTAVTTTTGNNTNGPLFRSWTGTSNPTRYFPRFESVMAGNLTVPADWESVARVARATTFRVMVRDNNANVAQQQTQNAEQKITVHANGPFKITSAKVYNNAPGPLTWDVVGTNAAPFNVANVKIDYTTDNGATWTVLSNSTPNDGSENFSFSSLPTGTALKVRISAIGNVFYAVAPVTVSQIVLCDGSAPVGLTFANVTASSAQVNWDAISGATYILRYKKTADATWTDIPVNTNSYTLSSLEEGTSYDAQVAAVCSGTTGTYSAVKNFTTAPLAYCTMTASDSTDEYISNVKVTPIGAGVMNSPSGATNYSNYAGDPTRLVTLVKGTTGNKIEVTKAWQGSKFNEVITVWIDFDRSGTYEDSEKVMATPANQITPISVDFAVPATAYSGDKTVGMRVSLKFSSAPTGPCSSYTYGEVEDYAVKILPTLGVNDNSAAQSVQVYPNPAIDVLNVTKVSDNATYTITNMAGQTVAKGKVASNKVPVSQLTKGAYVISINHNGEVNTLKFIKK